ncbi:IclR family transcriptional regulator [Rhodococcus wratislaviensis]|uniref:IclR family transcriptional regulator n=1 Tax=Rhodococcus wratislaviensis TaxID=44752 RepID=UPI00365B33A4
MEQASLRPAERPSGDVRSVTRAVNILRALSQSPTGSTLAEVAERVDLPISTVHRIVKTLIGEGLVVGRTPDAGLRLGPEFARLARLAQDDLLPVVRPYMNQLSGATGETVSLCVLEGMGVRFLDQILRSGGLHAVSVIGLTYPAHCTAGGKVLLAAQPEAFLQTIMPKRFERLTSNTIPTPEALLDELNVIRKQGFAHDNEEHTIGVSAVATVLRDHAGPVAALTIAMPTSRFGQRRDELTEVLLAVRKRIQNALALPRRVSIGRVL